MGVIYTTDRDPVGRVALYASDGTVLLGQKTKTTSLPVVLASDQDALALAASEAHVGAVGGHLSAVYVTVTRPSDTNAYAANDCVADSASAGTLASVALGRTATGNGLIVGLTLQNSNVAATHRMEVDIYNASITAINDNAEATRLAANKLKFIGTITLPGLAKKTTNSDQTEASDFTIRLPFQCAGDSKIYFVPRTLDAHTPASGTTYTFGFHVAQN